MARRKLSLKKPEAVKKVDPPKPQPKSKPKPKMVKPPKEEPLPPFVAEAIMKEDLRVQAEWERQHPGQDYAKR